MLVICSEVVKLKKCLVFLSLIFSFLICGEVHAYFTYNGVVYNEEKIESLFKEAFPNAEIDLANSNVVCSHYYQTSNNNWFQCRLYPNPVYFTLNYNESRYSAYYTRYNGSLVGNFGYYFEYRLSNNTFYSKGSASNGNTLLISGNDLYTNYDTTFKGNSYPANLQFRNIPDYLDGYKEVILEPGERYYMFSSSSITSGSVYIPMSDFNDYGSRISYFDNDLSTQPYTSYIQDFIPTSDGLYAKQDFDLSSYSGADFIMFSKYIYLEGPDNFSASIWVPEAMYSSLVSVTPNNTGGNDFDFSYVDENGELQANVISSSDLSPGSPLLSDLFTNFTTNDYGLSSIITAPIPLLQSLNNSSCSTVDLPLGVFGGVHEERLSLPCMTPVYSSIFGELFTLYQTITTGVIAYFIGLAYFNKIKQLKDPDNDSIEVINL